MTVHMFCKPKYETANETFRRIESMREIKTPLGTFIEIEDSNCQFHSLTKKHIRKFVIELED